MLVSWRMRWEPSQSQGWFLSAGQWAGSCHSRLWGCSFPVAGACPLVDRSGSQGLWLQASGVPRSSACTLACGVSSWAFGLVWPCPGATVGSRVLMQPVCLWVGLCAHPVICLACGVPVLVLAGWWVGAGLHPKVNKLEGGLQRSTC